MSHKISRVLLIILFLSQLISPFTASAGPEGQVPTPEEQAQALLENMTPEELVGQLFLVDFIGTDISEESPIYQLINTYHIGGVVLRAKNDNFSGPEGTLDSTWSLIQTLQWTEYQTSAEDHLDPVSGEIFSPSYIPLFVAISQDGNGYPSDQILNGLTPIPSPMAIGATWDPDLAFQTGEVLGKELSNLGFNFLIGPSLDILESPRPESAGDLGTRSFGGNPFWVSSMTSSFIAGIHTGSGNNIAVISKHFPGHGGSDRPYEEEIPTVGKTLEQLQQVELQPFFAVTGLATSPESTTDGLLLSRSKYQAFQETISPTTRPINLDAQAVAGMLALSQIADWREQGGLVVSDELGSRAIRRFYDPREETFSAHLVARDAFLAGNDLLILGDFTAPGDPDSLTTISNTLSFFAQKYREDIAFQQRVDDAVLRILTLKFSIYPVFNIGYIVSSKGSLEEIGTSGDVTFEVAQRAATLFSPSPENLANRIPSPPGESDRIVIITDTYPFTQCSTCPQEDVIGVDDLRQVIIRLYGPLAGGVIKSSNVSSYSLEDLDGVLSSEEGASSALLLADLGRADWVVFVMLDIDPDRPASTAIRRLLSERPDLTSEKKTILFALDAPYFMDATDISKLTAYYGLYSKQPQFLEVAARLLFKELSAPGASPVSVSSTNYVLSEAISPDVDQTIKVTLYLSALGPPAETGETPEPPVEYRTGDTVVIQTGKILDNNGHNVPDNSLVRFLITTTTTEGTTNQREINVLTISGVAKTNIILDTAGITQIQASIGDPSPLSEIIQIDVAIGEEVISVATDTVSPADGAVSTPSENGDETGNGETPPRDYTTLGDWLITLLVTMFIGLFAYQVGALAGQVRWGVRWGLAALVGGLAVNTYLSFNLPGVSALIKQYQIWGIVISTMIGAFLGWGAGVLWRRFSK